MHADIRQFRIGADNIGVLIHDPATGATAMIDAGQADPVLDALRQTGWTLSHILVTHHHGDHTAGIQALKAQTGALVVGPAAEASAIPGLDKMVGDGDIVQVGNLHAQILDTPGHTAGHIAYVFGEDGVAFVGDTLFAMGCGRILEGTPAQMWASLQRLAALPDRTTLYCGHDYSASNARFALTVDPTNKALVHRIQAVKAAAAAGMLFSPTTVADEKATNPFLRAGDASVATAMGMEGTTSEAVFAAMRERKNRF